MSFLSRVYHTEEFKNLSVAYNSADIFAVVADVVVVVVVKRRSAV